jgi:hypothetical protein
MGGGEKHSEAHRDARHEKQGRNGRGEAIRSAQIHETGRSAQRHTGTRDTRSRGGMHEKQGRDGRRAALRSAQRHETREVGEG